MSKITVDFSKTRGPIKPMHGIGQPPMVGINTDQFSYLSEAAIP